MIIKLIIIILVIILFIIFITYNLEEFSNKNYNNSNIIPCDFYNYKSYIPYDIISKDKNDKIYDFGNDELNILFNKIYKIDFAKIISLTEGINWSKWNSITEMNYSSRLYNYYINTFEDFAKGLRDKSLKINGTNYEIISLNLNRYKISIDNPNIYLLDISYIIYRPYRPLAKEVKVLSICNGIYTNFLMVKVIGVIPECELKSDKKISIYNKNDIYTEFTPTEYIEYDMNSFIYDTNDKLATSEAQLNLYNKLLKDLI